MTDSWYLIVIVVVAALVVLYLRGRQRNQRSGGDSQTGGDAGRDFGVEREGTRLTGMSAEDREWETASQRRNQENQDRAETPAAPRPAPGPDVVDRGPGG
ncbi:MAG: hypothetical protein M3464_13430 [Chloroflexota bacterium]|nr:hypothetical protein [Chloroflexota bacterium]